MKFSFVPQTFFSIFFFFLGSGSGSWAGSGFHYKFILEIYSLYTKDINQVWCRSAKFLWQSKFCSESGSGSGS